jgi:hypothetical protein
MRSLEQLDRWIAGRVKNWASKVAGTQNHPDLLEIRREILADVRDQIQPVGGGRSVFPYSQVCVRLWPPDSGRQDLFEAAFSGVNGLEQDIRALFAEAKAPVPAGFSVEVVTAVDPAIDEGGRPFRVDYLRSASAARTGKSVRPPARLSVLKGQADVAAIEIESDRVSLGRLKEVTSEKDGLRRRNDLAFADSETTVSREHASIRFHAGSGAFRIHDANSQRGTSIFREGRRIEVPRGGARGIQLQSGDEIHLGDARVLFEISG